MTHLSARPLEFYNGFICTTLECHWHACRALFGTSQKGGHEGFLLLQLLPAPGRTSRERHEGIARLHLNKLLRRQNV